MNKIIDELYKLYKQKVKEASDIFKSEYSCSREEDEERDKEDKEDLKYFNSLLKKLR